MSESTAPPERRTAYWTSVGDSWSRRRPQRLWRAHSDAVNRALLARWLPRACGRLLKTDAFDEAFGEGLIGGAPRAEDVWLIDLSATILAEARRTRRSSKAIVADVRRLPFPTGFFGTVVSISTLDHFDGRGDIEASIAEIHRVLSPGGCLIVTMDNPRNPVVALRNRLPWGWLNRVGLVPYYVGTTLDSRSLVETLERAGFDVTDVDALQHVPRAPTVAAAAVVSRLGWGGAERAFLAAVGSFERLRGRASRFRTGYFVAARGIRR
ncbi:MAG TPA: methyltransferase domain-containing protein [Gemmatimonadota bacterium]